MDYIDHHFRVDLAQKFGLDVAVFLHDVFYWVKYNRSNQKNFHKGRFWMYNTQAAFCENHPYWSRRQIERIIATCKSEDLLLTDCFNADPRDRTKWYTLTNKALKFFCDNIPELAECVSPNSVMPITERVDTLHETVAALPYNIPDSTKENPKAPCQGRKHRETKTEPTWKPERFAKFWDFYSRQVRGESKQAAIKAWDKLKPDDVLIVKMGHALQSQLSSEQWQQGIGIPYASTWLNQRRFEDAIGPVVKSPSGSTTGRWAADPEAY